MSIFAAAVPRTKDPAAVRFFPNALFEQYEVVLLFRTRDSSTPMKARSSTGKQD
jgi:hypothetical protein